MLNKVVVEGRILSFDEEKLNNLRPFYFNILVPNPNKSLSVLRCMYKSREEHDNKLELIKSDKFVKIRGFLRSDNFSDFYKHLTIVVVELEESTLSGENVEEKISSINFNTSNSVELLGTLVSDMKIKINKRLSNSVSFVICVPKIFSGGKGANQKFFCRVTGNDDLINNPLKTNDLVLVEGFIQTKKITKDFDLGTETFNKFTRITSIVCQKLTLINNTSIKYFDKNKDFKIFLSKITEINF